MLQRNDKKSDCNCIYILCSINYLFIDGCECFLPYADEGLVTARYYTDKSWYLICADEFTYDTANVICLENGYTNGVRNISSYTRTDEDYPIYQRRPNCTGDESSLCDCPVIDNTCGNEAVMVECVRQGNL